MAIVNDVVFWLQWHNNQSSPAIFPLFEKLVRRWITETVSFYSPLDAISLLEQIIDNSCRRSEIFIKSPEIYNRTVNRILIGQQPDISFILSSLAAEHCLRYGIIPKSLNIRETNIIWTASGDYSVNVFTSSKISHGLRIGSLLIDGESCFNIFDHDLPDEEQTVYVEPVLTCVRNKIYDSINCLSIASPAAMKMVFSSTQTIVVNRVDTYSNFFSGSRSSYIGKTAIVNAHIASHSDIIDALIHEAIHSMLYMIEIIEPFYLNHSSRNTHSFRSPWTGRMLALHSYTHACFVWFGLANFWQTFGADIDGAELKSQRAHKGFLLGSLSAPIVNLVNSSIIKCIDEMQNMIMETSTC